MSCNDSRMKNIQKIDRLNGIASGNNLKKGAKIKKRKKVNSNVETQKSRNIER